LKDDVDEAEFADGLNSRSEILSVTSVQELKDGFSQAFALMNMVVYVIIVLAGALAFVVLFTLSTTNISERERELATIKVLGFYDNEVHRYVNKETLILTGIGIAAGLPLGVGFSELLGMALKIPAIVYSPTIHKVSYLLAGGIAFGFALLVDLMTNRILNRIDPIEALKSVE
jgi:putative ABC transport system permease protein